MEIKQTKLSKVTKRLVLAILFMTSANLYAQNATVLGGKFKIESSFDIKDSILYITYENQMFVDQLIWVNDFVIASINSQSDVSGSYLASPIVHEIYLISKNKKIRKTSNNFFFRNDSTELNLYNYKNLKQGEKLELRLKIDNPILARLIVKRKLILRGVFSFIDFINVEFFKTQDQKQRKIWGPIIGQYTQRKNTSNTFGPISLKDIPWEFNRTPDTLKALGHIMGLVEQGRLSKAKMIHPLETNKNKLVILSFEELYRFSSKQNFEVKITLK